MSGNIADRTGITAAGNWIVDRVKTCDCLPGRGMLANVQSEEWSSGGAPANVLADLANLEAAFPLAGMGMVGIDEDAEYILDRFRRLGVDVSGIVQTDAAPTSYTDVMNEAGTGDRVFFHNRGANRLFEPRHVPVSELDCRIFHLGYLLLLDGMDARDDRFGTRAARLLHDLQQEGIKTSVDVVSEESDRFPAIVPPALEYVDYLIINEIEAGRITEIEVRDPNDEIDGPSLVEAVDALFQLGDMEMTAVHMPEGVYVRDREGNKYCRGSLDLPSDFIAGAVGAGDAFCAGMLYGLHEGWGYERSADLGTACAAAAMSVNGASEGVKPLEEVQTLEKRFGRREPPVESVKK